MTTTPSFSHKDLEQLEDIYKKLGALPNNESSFTQMESLFYDALTIAHHYTNSVLLFNLKLLQFNQYSNAQEKTLTSKMRVSAIRRFKNILRQHINSVLKKIGDPIN